MSSSIIPLLQIQGLTISFNNKCVVGGDLSASSGGVSFDIERGQTIGLVGESGSGKSLTAMSIINLLPYGARRQGKILWHSETEQTLEDLTQASPARLRNLRGRKIGCVFQDPMSSLNPVLRVGQQIAEPLIHHFGFTPKQALQRALEACEEVRLSNFTKLINSYPHELSGGQLQRVMIAMALVCDPVLLIADEPTTALDATTQRQIIELLFDIQQRKNMAMLFISHDLGVVRALAQKVIVMHQGVICEQGLTDLVMQNPRHSYTRNLFMCRPRIDQNPLRLPVIPIEDINFKEQTHPHQDEIVALNQVGKESALKSSHTSLLLEATYLSKIYSKNLGLFKKQSVIAVDKVSFKLHRGQTIGVVGESGSGKSTLALMLMGLLEPSGGSILLEGVELYKQKGVAGREYRRRLQMVFQNPFASLNPRFPILQTLLEPMRIHKIGSNFTDQKAMALKMLDRVGLDSSALYKYPHEFSGGQRQRIAIARCLTLNPDVLILDEAVSALDVSIQAQVLNLLKDLQDELSLSYIFITHDLAVVNFMADDVLVMKAGTVVEYSTVKNIIHMPEHPYTKGLLEAVYT